MNLASATLLFTTGNLWLARLSKFLDNKEGHWPQSQVDNYLEVGRNLLHTDPTAGEEYIQHELDSIPRRCCASCWTAADTHSPLHWSRYDADGGGVAVVTTYAKLRDALPPTCHIGLVRYVDFGRGDVVDFNSFIGAASFHKRQHFETESEIRVCSVQPEGFNQFGIQVPINIRHVADEILISERLGDIGVSAVKKICELMQLDPNLVRPAEVHS